MFRLLKKHNRLIEAFVLFGMTLMCFGLSLFRVKISETHFFLFLNWNLFLAFLPWFFSTLLIIKPNWRKNIFLQISILMLWLLFFPNAPYILTDLFHLRLSTGFPIWFDLVLILSFAWTGLLFGFISLRNIEIILSSSINKKVIPVVSSLLIFAGSFGVYIGRFLRWNSWDILREPMHLLYDIGDRFLNPFSHPRTWGVTIFMGIFLNVVYWSMRVMLKNRNTEEVQ
ncbi:MAG: DUF1361 domain-containing protein [Bacteroidetes bacterium HGW-Bacteroidetes-6]|jgi:uncharacterized membrane protein|nr:MAG: DUF1361 domain-containing protein [Bacteroidetes bacterium HGW-Bacteroidetes-6]